MEAHVSFVEGSEAELIRRATARPWRVEPLLHPQMPVHLAVTEDPDGELLAAVSLGDRSWVDRLARRLGARLVAGDGRSQAAVQMREYLDGHRREFDLRLVAIGSEFERQAWAALTRIPFGETRSYGEQARMLAAPGAARAVGRANGRNPIPIVVPCHRVIGSDGSLTGFAGGLALKRWLLAHEDVRLPSEAGPRLAAQNQLGLFDG
ncbi:MAG TPA: methylated-DNA--[protein]-cysteine S-methyltransferase [Enhygromyxa sp.]|nr:methylated-DNA--[protein]-cysteine S-methyltransferase [Enhygromyxa sp.]